MLSLKRFTLLADSYGGNLERWPEEFRKDALILLSTSETAQDIFARAQALDDLLTAATDRENWQAWPAGESAAVARLRARVAVGITSHKSASGRHRWSARVPATGGLLNLLQRNLLGLLAGGAIAIAGGLAIGLLYTSERASSDVFLLLEPTPLTIFSD